MSILSLSISLTLVLLCTSCIPASEEIGSSGNQSSSSSETGKLETLPVAVDEDGNPYHYEVETVWSCLDAYGDAPLMRCTADGEILFYFPIWADGDTVEYNVYRLTKNQETEPILNLPDKLDQWTPNDDYIGYPSICGFDVDDDGNIYILYNYTDSGYWELDIYDKAGNIVRSGQRIQNMLGAKLKRGVVDDFRYRDGRLYFLLERRMQVTTLEGDPLSLPLENRTSVMGFDFDENGLLYLTTVFTSSSEVLKMDPKNNYEILARQGILKDMWRFTAYSVQSGKIFSASENRIISCLFDGNQYQTEMQFGKDIPLTLTSRVSSYDNGLPTPKCLLTDDDGLLLSIEGNAKEPKETEKNTRDFHILRLKKVEGTSAEKEYNRILTITSAYRQDYLDEVVRLYQNSNPEVGVKWDILYNTKENLRPQTEEAGQKMVAKIMSNDVGDIVAVTGIGLNYRNFLTTDAFVDLKDRISQSQYYSMLKPSLLQAITIDGSIRSLPVGTAQNAMWYNNSLKPDLQVDDSITWNEILQIGLDHPDTPLFGIRSIENYGLLNRIFEANIYDLTDFEAKTVNLHEPWFVELMEKLKAVYDQGNLTVSIRENDSSRNYFFEPITLNAQGLHSDYHLQYLEAEGNITLMSVPQGEKNSNRFAYASRMYSISSNSKQQDVAWDFLEFLLSYGAQTLTSLDAIPVNRDAEQRRRLLYDGTFPEGLGKQLDTVENDIEYLYDTGSLRIQNVPLFHDYLVGTITLEDALKEAEYNIWLLLNE